MEIALSVAIDTAVITLTLALAAIGLAIIVIFYRNKGSIRVEDIHEMKG